MKGSALDAALAGRCSDLARATSRLRLLSAHDALLILTHSLSAPKLLYTLRCSPCSDHPGLDEFDHLLRAALTIIMNFEIDDLAWIQASLPVVAGGLGVRSVTLLAPSAFLASAAATLELQTCCFHVALTFQIWARILPFHLGSVVMTLLILKLLLDLLRLVRNFGLRPQSLRDLPF